MTKAHSRLQDNGGRCEVCDRPETAHMPQQTVPVFLGGGLGWGTMWACNECLSKRRDTKKGRAAGQPQASLDVDDIP